MRTLKQVTLAFLLVTIAFTGCKKDTPLKSDAQKPLSTEDLKLSAMVKSFKAQLKSPLKTGEIMQVDSVVWYMNLIANYDYGNAGVKLDDVSISETKIPLPVNGEYITLQDAGNLYDAVLDTVRAHYYSLGSGEKALTYVNITVDTIFNSPAPDAYQLNITSVVQTGIILIPTNFGPTDYWWWAEGGGKCGSYSGYTGKDAMTQLEYMYQINLPHPSGGYWVPETSVHEIPETFPATTTPTNYCGWYMFLNVSTLPNYHGCLTPDEMNFYLYGLDYIGNTLMAQKYPNIFYGHSYYCIGVRIYKNAFPFPNNRLAHEIYFDYGTAHYGNPGGEL